MKLETIKVPHEYERPTPVTLQTPTQFGRNDSTQLFYQAGIFPTAAVKNSCCADMIRLTFTADIW